MKVRVALTQTVNAFRGMPASLEGLAQLAEGLAVAEPETVEQSPPGWIGQRVEYTIECCGGMQNHMVED